MTTFGTTQTVVLSANVAVTVVSAPRITRHILVVEQPPPDHEKKTDEVEVGAGVRSIRLPSPNVNAHFEPQLIPAGVLITLPTPLPAFFTVSLWGMAARTNAPPRETERHMDSDGHETLTRGVVSIGVDRATQYDGPPDGFTEVTTLSTAPAWPKAVPTATHSDVDGHDTCRRTCRTEA